MRSFARALIAISMLGATSLSVPENPRIVRQFSETISFKSADRARPAVERLSKADPFGQLTLGFEENRGQTNREVRYLARAQGYQVFLTDREAVMVFADQERTDVLRLGLTGRARSVRPRPLEELPGRTNYIRTRNERQIGLRSYGRVVYEDVYPGIDQIFYGNQRQLEYDLVVDPGVDPAQIGLRIDGAQQLRLNAEGDLVLALGGEELRMSRPIAWQEIDGERRHVACQYVQTGEDEVGLQLGEYDRRHRLVIDPVIQYATYLGGSAGDAVVDLAIDGEGNAYLTGWTYSIDYPVRTGAWQLNHPGVSTAVFVTKLNPSGTALVYSTYLGPVDSRGHSIAVDQSGQVFLTGRTSSPNFPTTEGAMQPQPIGLPEWAFVTKLNGTGTALVYSTYLTGLSATTATTIAVDTTGSAVVAGSAGDGFPTTPEAYQPRFKGGTTDGFVARLDPIGATFEYATYLGGSDFDAVRAVTLDSNGHVYVTGVTTRQVTPQSTDPANGLAPQDQIPFSDFPVTRGAFQTVPRGRSDLFVTKLKSDGAALIYSTLLGGTGEEMAVSNLSADEPELGRSIAVDAIGNAYVTGTTLSGDFPTTVGSFQRSLLGVSDILVTKLNVVGSRLLYSTYLGGSNRDVAAAIAVDTAGNAFLTGWTLSANFPLTADGLRRKTPESSGVPTAFVTQLNKAGAILDFSTYLGGSAGEQGTCIAVSQAGSTYVGGFTSSADFPTTPRSLRPQLAGQQDGFVVRFVPGSGPLEVAQILPQRGGDGGSVWAILHGLQFKEGAVVRLVREGESEIAGTGINTGADGRTISVRFDLTGRRRGDWDLVVTNPDGLSATLRAGFTIEAAREPVVQIDSHWGPASLRAGQRQQYWISYQNTGNNDAYGVPVWIKVRNTAAVRIVSGTSLPMPLPGEAPIDFTQVPTGLINADGGQVVPLVLAIVPPGRTGYLVIEMLAPNQVGAAIPFEVWATRPIFDSKVTSLDSLAECYRSIVKIISTQAGLAIPQTCDGDILADWQFLVAGAIQQSLQSTSRQSQILSLNHLLTGLVFAGSRCAKGALALAQVNSAVSRTVGVRDDLRSCLGGRLSYTFWIITVVRSFPQFLNIGVVGEGPDRFVSPRQTLEYAIGFEHSAIARTSVREVTITDQLDLEAVDVRTFAFGPIVIANRVVVPVTGQLNFEEEIDLRPARNVIVRVVAIMKPDSGQVSWSLTTIDPLTGQPPVDPAVGFLPPNVVSPQGAGGVGYSISVRADLPSGSVIANQPSITFDREEANLAEPWTNKLDSVKPESRVDVLPTNQQSPNFTVRWRGADNDSGISGYSIFVQVDQGEWQSWQTNVTTTSATYNGTLGRRYAFYSVATDKVGNVEDPPLTTVGSASGQIVPDTTTIIQNYDLGMQDDRNGNFLLFNSVTGDYFVVNCGTGGFTFTGRAQVSQSGTMMTLTSALLFARIERRVISPFFADARFKQSTVGIVYTILDRNQSNNTWRCSQ